MSVALLAIKFNHDSTSATKNALNIRRNGDVRQFVPVPEWQRGFSVNPSDSVAAYAIEETRGQTITIQAKFARDDPQMTAIEVRAVQPKLTKPPDWWLQWLLSPLWPSPAYYYYLWYYTYLWQLSLLPIVNVLGEVKARQVIFHPNGETDFETFELENLWLWSRGVGVHNVTWRWQFRNGPGHPWSDFDESSHKIYTVLQVPTEPWRQLPHDMTNTQLPWTEVLDYACRWAQGTMTLDDAATSVTRAVNNLGPAVIEYDCPNHGLSHYIDFPFNRFECSHFLRRLRGDIRSSSQYVNCRDCACIVSTFANILGCNLSQSQMFPSSPSLGFFALNPILAIGSTAWQIPCGQPGFEVHEVAWKGACTENNEVFDACLQVDGDPDPTGPPHIPLLPVNIRFGNPGDGQYRDRLAAPTPLGRPNCQPQPRTRQRRKII